MNDDIKYWIAISKINGIGPARFKKIYSYFSSMEQAWSAGFQEFKKTGLEEKIINEIIDFRNRINPDREIEKIEKENIRVVTILDENYPKLLKEIYSSPAILYYKGTLNNESDEFAIGAVGTRKFSPYGKQITENIIKQLASQNITIVSGLALGIDGLAHQATIDQKGRTIAVLGSGLDKQNIYPSSNRYLSQKIVETGGLLISEYPVGTMPLKQNFPQRNRIISGLSLGVLVIEAPENSGALLTANYALEQNRDVFAVPGNIYNINSVGPNNLIKMGAKLITNAEDILDAMNLQQVTKFIANKKISPDTKEEAIVLKILSNEPTHINKIIKKSNLGAALATSTITLMEMKGKIKNLGNMMYVLGR